MNNNSDSGNCGCGCGIAILLFNLTVGILSVNYLVWVFWQKTIPTLGALLIAAVGGEVIVPLALVVWLLKAFGVF